MQIIRVKKNELVEIVQKNLKDHRAVYEEAIQNYEKKRVKRIQKLAKRAIKDPNVDLLWVRDMPKPEDHSDDYRSVLDQLRMETRNEIDLPYQEFETLVRNKWNWTNAFITSTRLYNG